MPVKKEPGDVGEVSIEGCAPLLLELLLLLEPPLLELPLLELLMIEVARLDILPQKEGLQKKVLNLTKQ